MLINDATIGIQSRSQRVVSLRPCEAEYSSLVSGPMKVLRSKKFIEEITGVSMHPPSLLSDPKKQLLDYQLQHNSFRIR